MDAQRFESFISAADRDYWLSRCQGFRVESVDGRIGTVEELRFGSRADRPDQVVIRAGLFGRRRLILPVDEVAKIVPREKRMILRGSPRITATESGPG